MCGDVATPVLFLYTDTPYPMGGDPLYMAGLVSATNTQ